jgi:hypothetical protein
MLNNSYEFDALEGKTLAELEGLGVISRFDDGSLISKSGADTFVKFNVGTKHVLGYVRSAEPSNFWFGRWSCRWYDCITKNLALSHSEVETQTQELQKRAHPGGRCYV